MENYIMVESLNHDNEWTWYAVIRNTTPEEAIQHYLKETGLDTSSQFLWNNGVTYDYEENVRAYEMTITDI